MENIPAQTEEIQSNIPLEVTPAPPPPVETTPQIPSKFPFKKLLPVIIIGIIVLLLLSGVMVLGKTRTKLPVPTPTVRPTATPINVPTMPEVTKVAVSATISVASPSTVSATIYPAKTGKLAFIKEGDIYQSDLSSFSLLVKNKNPAGDKLAWSSYGRYLSFRPKSNTGVPESVIVYDNERNSFLTIKSTKSGTSEVIDFAFSPDEKQIALLYHDASYNLSVFPIATSSGEVVSLLNRSVSMKQILWPETQTIIFSGEDGLSSIDTASTSAKLLISNKNVQLISRSPVGRKILYSVGTNEKSDLYLVNIDGNFNQLLKAEPSKIDMGTTEAPVAVTDNGFIPYALFYPDGDKLLVGYHYLPGLPLVGIYDLKDKSFKAVAPFPLSGNDILINEQLLIGSRVVTKDLESSWQVSLYTMETGAKLKMVRVISEATSPSFFGTYNDK